MKRKGGSLFGRFPIGILLGILVLSVSPAFAAFPEKPIQIVNPYPAGGDLDMIFRVVSAAATPYFGQPVVVVNKGGGGGSVGVQYVAQSKPDGYTLCAATLGTVLLHPLVEKAPFSYKDFVAIGQCVINQIGFFVKADAPWATFNDFVKYAKERPKEIKYATAGVGTIGHVLMESVCQTAGGVKMVHVPFQGTGPALTALMGGHVPIANSGVQPALPLVESKKIRPIVISNTERVKTLPDIPALPELGYRGVDVWVVLLAPKATPPAVVKHLEQALEATLKDNSCSALLKQIGQKPAFMNGEKLTAKIIEDEKYLADVVAKIGLAKK